MFYYGKVCRGMISSLMFMQNAILSRNIAQAEMFSNCEKMLSSISFGNSQPLKPSFTGDILELRNKINETKITRANKLIESMDKLIAQKIKRSTPKYSGLDSKKS